MNYKFRAWDKEANIMIYSDHRTRKLYDVYYGFEMNGQGELECRWEGEFTESHVLDGGTLDNLMQFTGIHDKNGKEIYEGDIIEKTYYSYHQPECSELFEIKYEGLSFHFEHIKGSTFHLPFTEDIEIIGNIHDNPELVED